MAPPGGWKVPQLIEGSKSYQADPLHMLPPAQRVMVPLNDLGPPRSKFSVSAYGGEYTAEIVTQKYVGKVISFHTFHFGCLL